MIIPKYLQRPGMSKDEIKNLDEFVLSRRKLMKDIPVFPTSEEAVKEAVKQVKKDDYTLASVYKEPKDIGTGYAVVLSDNYEDALVAGYTEVVDDQAICDIATGNKHKRIDNIKEV